MILIEDKFIHPKDDWETLRNKRENDASKMAEYDTPRLWSSIKIFKKFLKTTEMGWTKFLRALENKGLQQPNECPIKTEICSNDKKVCSICKHFPLTPPPLSSDVVLVWKQTKEQSRPYFQYSNMPEGYL